MQDLYDYAVANKLETKLKVQTTTKSFEELFKEMEDLKQQVMKNKELLKEKERLEKEGKIDKGYR